MTHANDNKKHIHWDHMLYLANALEGPKAVRSYRKEALSKHLDYWGLPDFDSKINSIFTRLFSEWSPKQNYEPLEVVK